MSALASANQALFNFTVVFMLIALIGALFGIDISQTGITVSPTRPDLPLIGGLLLLFIGNYNYYVHIIRPKEESPHEALVSLVGMLVMASLPLIVLWEPLRPWRYLAIAVYGALVVVKNHQLSKKYREGQDALIYRIWTRRALLQTGACFLIGIVFLQLTHPPYRDAWFHRILDAPVLVFKPTYGTLVNLTFNVMFLAAIVALYLLHHNDLIDLAKMKSDDASRGSESR
jgi:hypothetical protein